jgi:hypothetical protein
VTTLASLKTATLLLSFASLRGVVVPGHAEYKSNVLVSMNVARDAKLELGSVSPIA